MQRLVLTAHRFMVDSKNWIISLFSFSLRKLLFSHFASCSTNAVLSLLIGRCKNAIRKYLSVSLLLFLLDCTQFSDLYRSPRCETDRDALWWRNLHTRKMHSKYSFRCKQMDYRPQLSIVFVPQYPTNASIVKLSKKKKKNSSYIYQKYQKFLVEYFIWVDVVYNPAVNAQRQRGALSLLKIAQNIVI